MADTESLTKEEQSFFDNKGAVSAPETPVVTPAPEAKPAAPEKPAVVPQQSLHEERERRKGLQKELEEAKLREAKLGSRLSTLEELARAQSRPVEPVIPDK